MDTADSGDGHIRRRRVNARRGMAFSGNSMSHSSSGNTVANIDDEVEQAVMSPPATIPPRPEALLPPMSDDPSAPGEFSPSQRLQQVGRRSSMYEREYRLNLIHRMIMRKVPLDEVATALGISVSQVMRDRKELFERLRTESRALDIDLIVGDSKGMYEEVLGMAMRIASKDSTPVAMRLAAMRTGLAAENDKHRFLQAAGVYDVLRYRRAAGDGQLSDIQRLLSLTTQMLDEAESKGLDMKDPDADTALNESEDL